MDYIEAMHMFHARQDLIEFLQHRVPHVSVVPGNLAGRGRLAPEHASKEITAQGELHRIPRVFLTVDGGYVRFNAMDDPRMRTDELKFVKLRRKSVDQVEILLCLDHFHDDVFSFSTSGQIDCRRV